MSSIVDISSDRDSSESSPINNFPEKKAKKAELSPLVNEFFKELRKTCKGIEYSCQWRGMHGVGGDMCGAKVEDSNYRKDRRLAHLRAHSDEWPLVAHS